MRSLTLTVAVGLTACFQPVISDSVIGPTGGTVTAPGGVTIVVPAGALMEPTRISVTSQTVEPPKGMTAAGGAFVFGPEGLQFAKPITLELPLTSERDDVLIATAPASSRDFEFLPATRTGLVARVEVSHFSIFIPVNPGPTDPIERCQTNWDATTWWNLGGLDAGANVSQTEIIETPAAWIFTVGGAVFSVDRATGLLVEMRDTSKDTPPGFGGYLARSVLRLPSEVLIVSLGSQGGYAEWRMDLDGRFKATADGGVVRTLWLPGPYLAAGAGHITAGATWVPSWDAVVLGAGVWSQTPLGVVPHASSTPWTVPIPTEITTSTSAVELADGTVMIGLLSPDPLNAQSRKTEAYVLGMDGGLTATGWVVRNAPKGVVMKAGVDGGPVMLSYTMTDISVWERDHATASWVGAIALSPTPLILDGVKSTPDGLLVGLVVKGEAWVRWGVDPYDAFIVTYPPGKIAQLGKGLLAYTPPGIGGLRNDSFMFAYFDLEKGLMAARLCLP